MVLHKDCMVDSDLAVDHKLVHMGYTMEVLQIRPVVEAGNFELVEAVDSSGLKHHIVEDCMMLVAGMNFVENNQ